MKAKGRPERPPELRKTNILKIRLSESERLDLDAAADGKTSTWARDVLLRAAKKKKKP